MEKVEKVFMIGDSTVKFSEEGVTVTAMNINMHGEVLEEQTND